MSNPNAPEWSKGELGAELVSAEALRVRVEELGAAITRDYAGKAPLIIGVLKGAAIFVSDLIRAIELPVAVEFMAVSSYGAATKSSGVVQIMKDLDVDIAGREVIIVEDVVDSGLTLNYLLANLGARGPASLAICTLLHKVGLQETAVPLAYVGFEIADDFVVGYGIDVAERYRNLEGIYAFIGRQ